MELKGGVIIIGSLLWDNSPIRAKWRKLCLENIEKKIPVKLRIRYGRISESRGNTHTMIFSNHDTTELGVGYILGFKEKIKNFRYLEKQAYSLALAEGIWKEINDPKIFAGWGGVALAINPKLIEKDKKSSELIINRWKSLYNVYQNVNPMQFRIETEISPISASGLLQIAWTEEMAGFDFLIGTPVKPKPRRILSLEEIAKNKNDYFRKNQEFGIKTFQDQEIMDFVI